MADPAKQESMSLEDLIRTRLSPTDSLAKILAKVLIDKGIVTVPELMKELVAETRTGEEIDTRGKKWVR